MKCENNFQKIIFRKIENFVPLVATRALNLKQPSEIVAINKAFLSSIRNISDKLSRNFSFQPFFNKFELYF